MKGRGAKVLKPVKGQGPDKLPAQATALEIVRRKVSSKFVRREAALAASDAHHARIIAERFSLLRTRILREMRNRGWTRLAVVPVTADAGGTYVALNLSLAIAMVFDAGVYMVVFCSTLLMLSTTGTVHHRAQAGDAVARESA